MLPSARLKMDPTESRGGRVWRAGGAAGGRGAGQGERCQAGAGRRVGCKAIVWLYVVWHEYCCILAWVESSLLSYGRTSYGVSIIAFVQGEVIFDIIRLYAVWHEHSCLWPRLPHLCHCMVVCRMARVSLYVAWVNSSLLSHSNTPYGVSIIAFGLGYLIFAILWLYVVWRKHCCC